MRINENFLKERTKGECVLVPTDKDYKSGIFHLNETAERIYDLLCKKKDRDEIVAILCEEYDTSQKTAEEYADDYIAELRKIGVITDD